MSKTGNCRRFRQLLTALLLAALPVVAMAQVSDDPERRQSERRRTELQRTERQERVFYKGRIHVSRVSVSRESDRVRLGMRVTYSTDLLNRGEKLYVSPQLRDDNNRTTFAPMVFDGKSRKWRVRDGDVIVVADEAYGQFFFDIEFVGSYREWMQGSSLCFVSEEVTGKNVRDHFTDCLFEDLRIDEYAPGDRVPRLRPHTPGDAPRAGADSVAGPLPAPVASDARRQSRDSVLAEMVRRQALDSRPGDSARVSGDASPSGLSSPVVSTRERSTDTGDRHRVSAPLHLRTNLLYDAALLPCVGVEVGLGGRLSLAVGAGGNWLSFDRSHLYWRLASADAELRLWLGKGRSGRALRHQGHHVGVYAAAYRYDLEFGGDGQMGDLNYGCGVSYGYSVPIGRRLSLDLGVGVGYIGGKYKRYEPRIDGRYYWLSDNTRSYLGPTRAEVTLVWHVGN